MKKTLVIALLSLLPLAAAAQTVSMKVNSIWSFTEDQKNSLSATLLRKNATTGNLEPIPGQRLALEQMKITYGSALIVPESMSATFPGQKTVPMTVVGVRLFHRGSGTGWVMRKDGEIDTDPLFSPPLLVPAGQKVFCLYRMPVREMGDLTCTVGAPTVVQPPVVVPPVIPPATGASKPGDQSPPLAQIVAKDGAVWTLVAGQVLRNGVNTQSPYSPNVSRIYISDTYGIHAFSGDHGYICWGGGTTWGYAAGC